MVWGTPLSFTTGVAPSAAQWNAGVRDNFKAIGDAWTTYVPTWTASVNPAIGNGTLAGRYMSAGKLTHFTVQVTMGGTTTYGTGQWSLGLPAGLTPVTNHLRFNVNCFDTSASQFWQTSGMWLASSSMVAMWALPTTAGNQDRALNSTAPFTWASGDILTMWGTYEAA